MDNLAVSLKIASAGLDVESLRMRVVSENLANAQSTSEVKGGDPYQRKLVNFETILLRESDASSVGISGISGDRREFQTTFDPGHPAADDAGYVKMPNVNPIIEMADMREANRSYQANLEVFKQARDLIGMTIELMRSGR
ncbi:flagellar basal body rod protein FlgC [Ahrensia marina]|jgi:flagellar basal-body rod protein FlgC|uniref:Flagellar basal-body rod protein FlgC n=1 Tax=Ahrensia marina TaxID=1514904 RepID=A0A0M9GLL7_9HYPH|nr:flagellar basal body rod protein FlgC [Ahrensia marina]KPB00707.1 flagellar basal body rod protein FlgC [Ahrensia marina]